MTLSTRFFPNFYRILSQLYYLLIKKIEILQHYLNMYVVLIVIQCKYN